MKAADSSDTLVNLAILVAVSDYTSLSKLPGCKGDIEVMTTILEGTDKFSDTLKIHGSVRSQSAKSQLADFIDRNNEKRVGEVLFYYSGHGTASSDDFLFLFSDYEERLTNQTTLSNKELDGMLKSLNPQLTVKVIDACHSGVSYVKDSDILNATFEKSKGQFKKCYFMFSSQTYESSWQDASMSYFTSEFKNAVGKHSSDKIRYKDIIDAISDAFQSDQRQTPFFITQADFTEIFCHNPSKLQMLLSGSTAGRPEIAAPPSPVDATGKTSLLEVIKNDASRYCNKDEVAKEIKVIEQQVGLLLNATDLDSLYSILVEHESASNLPKKRAIAEWFTKKSSDFFIDYTYEEEEYQTYVDPPPPSTRSAFYGFSMLDMARLQPQVLATRTRSVVSGVYPTVEMEYQALIVKLLPSFPNLVAWHLYLFPVFSRVHIRLFYCFVRMIQNGWDDLKPSAKDEWKTKEEEIRSGRVPEMVNSISKEFVEVVTKQIADAFAIDAKDISEPTKS